MRIALLACLAVSVLILIKTEDLKDWQAYLMVVLYGLFEILSTIFHLELGIAVISLSIMLFLIALIEISVHARRIDTPPVVIYTVASLFTIGFIIQIIETFAGRIF